MTTSANQKTGRSLLGNGWFVAVCLLACLFSVLVVSVILITIHENQERQRVRAEINGRLDAIRAAGQPLTGDDLAKLHPDPLPERDPVLLLKPALESLSIPEQLTNVPFFSTQLKRSADLGESEKFESLRLLDRNRMALGSIPWDRLKGTRIGAGFARGVLNVTHSPLTGLLKLTRLMCLRAVLEAEFQETHKAMESLQQALSMSEVMEGGLPIQHFARAAAENRVCQTLERIVSRTQVTDADLVSLSRALTITNTAAVKDILFELRCLGLSMAGVLQSNATALVNGVVWPQKRLLRAYQAELLYRDEDLLQYLDWSQQCSEVLDLPVSNAISRLQDIEKQSRQIKPISLFTALKRERLSFLRLQEPQVSQFLSDEVVEVAQVRAALTAIAIERWRLVHRGQLPESLISLVPEYLSDLPTDPFNEQTLRYKILAHGYRVYSVGLGGRDQGRNESPDAEVSSRYELGFAVER